MMNRRQFSQFTAALGIWFSWGKPKSGWAAPNNVGTFKATDWKTLELFFDELVPNAVAMGLTNFLRRGFDEEMPGWKLFPKRKGKIYSSGYARFVPYYQKLIERLNAADNRPFSELPAEKRKEIVEHFSKTSKSDVGYRVVGTPPVNEISDNGLFELVRRHAIEAYLSEPIHGGNKDYKGWIALGHVCHMNYPDKPDSCPVHH